jgi:prepilin signal peptidase PulO-like enzyme (type II secretory pathway)
VLGGALGTVDWQLAVSALALAAGTTATVGVLRRMRHIAFGPGLAFAATVALIAHPLLLPGVDATSPTGAAEPSLHPTELTLDEAPVP